MNPLVRLIRRYPLTVFFVLAYAIAWAPVPVGSFVEGAVPSELWSYLAVWSALVLVLLIADRRRWLERAPLAATSPVERNVEPVPANVPVGRSR